MAGMTSFFCNNTSFRKPFFLLGLGHGFVIFLALFLLLTYFEQINLSFLVEVWSAPPVKKPKKQFESAPLPYDLYAICMRSVFDLYVICIRPRLRTVGGVAFRSIPYDIDCICSTNRC